MKITKMITAALILVSVLAAPVFAATQELPKAGMGVGGGNLVQFVTDGKDGISSPMTVDMFKKSTAIVFEAPEHDWGAIVFGGGKGNGHSNPGWAIQIENDKMGEYFKDGKYTFDFKKLGIDVKTFAGDGSDDVFFAAYIGRWNGQGGFDEMGITKAYLVYDSGNNNTAKKSGDGSMAALAVGAFALAAGVSVVLSRRLKDK